MIDNPKILVIEDNPEEREGMAVILAGGDYEVIEAETGEEGLKKAKDYIPDIILLDYWLPDINGDQVMLRLNESSTIPVVFVTGKIEPEFLAGCKEAGAVDYLKKPYSAVELLTKTKHVLKYHGKHQVSDLFKSGCLEVDLAARIVKVKGETVGLTNMNFQILELFVKNPGKILVYKFILNEIWKRDGDGSTEVLRTKIKEIREIIEDDHANPKFIITVRGVGYRFDIPE